MSGRPPTCPFFAFFRDFLRVFPEKKILYRRSRKQELREFGGYFSLKRAPALRSEILSGEFGREGRLLQSPLTQGVLQAAIKKVRTQGPPRTEIHPWATRRSVAWLRGGEPEVRQHFRQPCHKRRRRAGGGKPPHERKREADRRFCAENAVFRAQKTETRRSAPPYMRKWGGRRDSNPRPPGPQPGALTN